MAKKQLFGFPPPPPFPMEMNEDEPDFSPNEMDSVHRSNRIHVSSVFLGRKIVYLNAFASITLFAVCYSFCCFC